MTIDRNPHESAFINRLDRQQRRLPRNAHRPRVLATTDPLHLGHRPPRVRHAPWTALETAPVPPAGAPLAAPTPMAAVVGAPGFVAAGGASQAPRGHGGQSPTTRKETTMPTVSARSLKVVAVLDAAELARISTPEGGPARIVLNVRLPDRVVVVDLAAKAIKRAKATIAELGPEGVAVVVQGRLLANPDRIADAGLVAQPRAKKAEAEPVTAPANAVVAA
jgi:hypothetical protein